MIIPVTTSDVTNDVDVMKAVAYLYDSRHDDGTDHDKVWMSLMRESSPGAWTPVKSDFSTDNKSRAFIYDPAPGRYAIRLTGVNVSANGEGGCGEDEMLVWYSYMHEDSDRETAENLSTVRPEDHDVD